MVARPGQGEHQVERAHLGLRVFGELLADVAALAVMRHRRSAIARAKIGGGDVILREGDVPLGQDRRLLGLEPCEEAVQRSLGSIRAPDFGLRA